MQIRLIGAMSAVNKGVGFKNTIPWKQKADMNRFRDITQEDGVMIMGFNTFKSFGGHVLPKRIHIVLTDVLQESTDERVVYASSMSEAIEKGKEFIQIGKGKNIAIIGGPGVWKEGSLYADVLNLSYIKTDESIQFDAFFPDIDMTGWKEVKRESFEKDSKNDFDYEFVDYVRG